MKPSNRLSCHVLRSTYSTPSHNTGATFYIDMNCFNLKSSSIIVVVVSYRMNAALGDFTFD